MAEAARDPACVEEAAARGDEPTAVYEVRLQGTLAGGLGEQFPAARVATTRTETVLYLQVDRPAELDALLDHLFSLGLVPTEVQQRVEPGGGVGDGVAAEAPGRPPR